MICHWYSLLLCVSLLRWLDLLPSYNVCTEGSSDVFSLTISQSRQAISVYSCHWACLSPSKQAGLILVSRESLGDYVESRNTSTCKHLWPMTSLWGFPKLLVTRSKNGGCILLWQDPKSVCSSTLYLVSYNLHRSIGPTSFRENVFGDAD